MVYLNILPMYFLVLLCIGHIITTVIAESNSSLVYTGLPNFDTFPYTILSKNPKPTFVSITSKLIIKVVKYWEVDKLTVANTSFPT